MKHITKIILFVLLFSYSAKMKAQSFDSLQIRLDYIVSGLDTSKIQTGLLYDKTTHFLNLSKYNGAYDTITTYGDAKWLLNRVNHMQTDTGYILPDWYLDYKLLQFDTLKVNPLIILNYKYDKIKSNAIESGWIDTLNGRFVDITNPSQSPYEQDYIITATFAFPTMGYTNTARFIFDQSLYFSNYADAPEYVNIDFADGNGYRKVNWGDTITINYQTGSVTVYTIKIQLFDNSPIINKTYFKAFNKTGNAIDLNFPLQSSTVYGSCDELFYYITYWVYGGKTYDNYNLNRLKKTNPNLYNGILKNGVMHQIQFIHHLLTLHFLIFFINVIT